MRRRSSLLVALTFVLSGVGAVQAYADDTPPIVPPPGVTDPGAGASAPTGPTYEVTPGVGGSHLGKPVDPKVAAQHADQAAKKAATPKKVAPQGTPRTDGATVSPPTALPSVGAGRTTREDVLWEIGAGALLVLLVWDLLRVVLRRRPRPSTP